MVEYGSAATLHVGGGLDAFITGGYSAFVGQEQAGHFVNVGGGGTYWLDARSGFRLEFRTHTPTEGFFRAHAFGLRVAFTQAL